MTENKSTIPELVYEGVSSTVTRWWNRLTRWRSYDPQNNDNDNSLAYEDVNTAIPLKSILKKDGNPLKRTPSIHHVSEAAEAVMELANYNTRGRKRAAAPNRKGPLPTAELPIAERGQVKSTHATLNPKSFGNEQGDPSSSMLPCNRGLLTYFATMAETSSEDENIDLLFVESLLNAGADVNVGDKYGQTILHAIVKDWDSDLVKYAVSRGADINRRDKYGRTPLHVAAATNYPTMIEYLLKNGAKLDARTDGENQTPVHYAAKNNAVDSMKYLLKHGGKISDRDYKDRTPLFLAAEEGREDMVDYLLDLGAPAAVYDIHGNCVVSLMVDKMPELAYKALNQFMTVEKASRKVYYYLCNLDFDVSCKLGRTPARPILETIVYKKDIKLVQHPVIQKLIAVKWKKFAGFSASLDIITNIIYACVFTSLTLLLPDKSFYYPMKKWGWRFGVEALFLLMTFYFVYMQIKTARRANQRHQNWKKWRIQCMSRNFKYCHPQWPEERRYLKQNIQSVQDMPVTHFRNGWNWYEWISFVGIIAIIAVQTAYHITKNDKLRFGVFLTYTVELLLVWLRLLKPFRTLPALSALIVMLGDIIASSAKFFILFLQFFIPIMTSFYVMFGGEWSERKMKASNIEQSDIQSYATLPTLIFTIYQMVFAGSFSTEPYEVIDRTLSHFMFSISLGILNILCVNLFIALLSQVAQRVYMNAQANALLQRADCLLQAERNLSMKKAKRIRKYMRRECSPLETYELFANTSNEGKKLEDVVESVTSSITKISLLLAKDEKEAKAQPRERSQFLAWKIKNNINQIATINEDAEKLLSGKWQKIQDNQKRIAELLTRPEIKEFLERQKAVKKAEEKKRSLEREHSQSSRKSRSDSVRSRPGSVRSTSSSSREVK